MFFVQLANSLAQTKKSSSIIRNAKKNHKIISFCNYNLFFLFLFELLYFLHAKTNWTISRMQLAINCNLRYCYCRYLLLLESKSLTWNSKCSAFDRTAPSRRIQNKYNARKICKHLFNCNLVAQQQPSM